MITSYRKYNTFYLCKTPKTTLDKPTWLKLKCQYQERTAMKVLNRIKSNRRHKQFIRRKLEELSNDWKLLKPMTRARDIKGKGE